MVASLWGEEFIQFLALLAFALTGRFELQDELHQENLKEMDEFILFFKIILGKIASTPRNLINKFLPPKQKRRPLPFLLSLSFFYEYNQYMYVKVC